MVWESVYSSRVIYSIEAKTAIGCACIQLRLKPRDYEALGEQ